MKIRLALGAVLAGLCASMFANTSADALTRPPSCTTYPVKSSGVPWKCTFADDFTGSTLNSSKWLVQTTAFSGFATADTCYLNSPKNVFVANGSLNLVARTETSSLSCSRSKLATFTTKHTGGAVVSYDRFQQAYGRFEFRAKFPNTREAGFHGNLWLVPRSSTYGSWPNSGEIDVAEQWSGHGDEVYPSLHYQGSTKADSAWTCTVSDVRQFHLYRLEWTPTVMKFYYDNNLCFQRSWTPAAPLTAPQPFDVPFYTVMSQGFGDPFYPISSNLPAAGSMVVDWVRAWK